MIGKGKELESADRNHIIHLRKGTFPIPLRRRVWGAKMAVMSLENWVDAVQSQGRYFVLRREALRDSGLSAEAVKKALQRLERRGRLAKAKNYFYVIIPLEYSKSGGLPPAWYIDDLMKAMKRPYYVGLLSAAALHGASHQQPQEFQVVTDRFARSLRVGRVRIRLLTNKHALDTPIQEMKTPTGTMRVSNPEATVVDLVRCAKAAGGLDNVVIVLADLLSRLDERRLLKVVRLQSDVPNAQRLGYLLDKLRARSLSKALHAWIEQRSPSAVSLRPGEAVGDTAQDRRWNVLIGEPIEIEM
jgi:predicted transcriptional regulator of viral defense system